MTGPLDEVVERLREMANVAIVQASESVLLQPGVSSGLFIAAEKLDAFAASHRLIDITVCGEQCPGLDVYGTDEGGVYGDCVPMGRCAPIGKPCIWRKP